MNKWKALGYFLFAVGLYWLVGCSLAAYYIAMVAEDASIWIIWIPILIVPPLAAWYGGYRSLKKSKVTAAPPPPPPAPVRQPTVPPKISSSQEVGRRKRVKVEGLTEMILIKEGPPPDEQYVVDVLRALCPEVASIKNLTVHAEATGTSAPDEIYVITRLLMRKGAGFDVAGKTLLQEYTDRQGHHGFLVYVYEDAVRPEAPAVPPTVPLPAPPPPEAPPAKKYCAYCGAGMSVEAIYCPSCGKKQVEEEAPAPLTVPPQPEAPKLPEAEWEKRYRFLSFGFGKRSECPFMDSSGKCVSPAAATSITACTCSRGYRFCHVYPIHMKDLPVWKTEYENRMRMEARMEGSVGECKICGNNRKLDRDHVCSLCVLAIDRANEVFAERKKTWGLLNCDWCMRGIKRGEAFLSVTGGYLCCVDCWKRIYANY